MNDSDIVTCNGRRVADHRKSCGLTQIELAEESGYSLRLVGKAEQDGQVRFSGLVAVAIVLQPHGATVAASDLCVDPVQVAQQFCEAYRQHEAAMVLKNRNPPLLQRSTDSQRRVACLKPSTVGRTDDPVCGESNGQCRSGMIVSVARQLFGMRLKEPHRHGSLPGAADSTASQSHRNSNNWHAPCRSVCGVEIEPVSGCTRGN